MYTVISTEELTSILCDASDLETVQPGENRVFFSFIDAEGDRLRCCVHNLGDRIAFVLMIEVPKELFLAAILGTNKYNNTGTQSTFAYATKAQGGCYVCLEQDLELGNGVTRSYIMFCAENFLSKINDFEMAVFSAMREIGEDSNVLRDGCRF